MPARGSVGRLEIHREIDSGKETPKLLGEWSRAPLIEEKRHGWMSLLLEADGRDRPVRRGKTKHPSGAPTSCFGRLALKGG